MRDCELIILHELILDRFSGDVGRRDEEASARVSCQADGQLGKFGLGSKQAAFVYGDSVRCITRNAEGMGSLRQGGDRTDYVYEMTLSTDGFEAKMRAGKDWFENTIRKRPSLAPGWSAESHPEFNALRTNEVCGATRLGPRPTHDLRLPLAAPRAHASHASRPARRLTHASHSSYASRFARLTLRTPRPLAPGAE